MCFSLSLSLALSVCLSLEFNKRTSSQSIAYFDMNKCVDAVMSSYLHTHTHARTHARTHTHTHTRTDSSILLPSSTFNSGTITCRPPHTKHYWHFVTIDVTPSLFWQFRVGHGGARKEKGSVCVSVCVCVCVCVYVW